MDRLEARAEHAERHAAAALVVLGAMKEAAAAILDAITARRDADEGKEGWTTKV